MLRCYLTVQRKRSQEYFLHFRRKEIFEFKYLITHSIYIIEK